MRTKRTRKSSLVIGRKARDLQHRRILYKLSFGAYLDSLGSAAADSDGTGIHKDGFYRYWWEKDYWSGYPKQ